MNFSYGRKKKSLLLHFFFTQSFPVFIFSAIVFHLFLLFNQSTCPTEFFLWFFSQIFFPFISFLSKWVFSFFWSLLWNFFFFLFVVKCFLFSWANYFVLFFIVLFISFLMLSVVFYFKGISSVFGSCKVFYLW